MMVNNPYFFFYILYIICITMYVCIYYPYIDNTKLLLRTVEPSLQQRLLRDQGLEQTEVSIVSEGDNVEIAEQAKDRTLQEIIDSIRDTDSVKGLSMR